MLSLNNVRWWLGVTLLTATAALAQPRYHSTIIQGPVDFPGVFPFAVNSHGQVTGKMLSGSSANEHAFIWSNGVLTDLGTPPNTLGGVADFIEAHKINNAGLVGGQALVDDPLADQGHSFRAFVWKNGTMTVLDPLPTAASSNVIDIDNAGNVLVESHDDDGSLAGYYLWNNGVTTAVPDLALPTGEPVTLAAMNDTGLMVGTATVDVFGPDGDDFVGHVIIYNRQTMQLTDLGFLPGDEQFGATGYAVNSGGSVVGVSSSINSDMTALLGRVAVWKNGVVQNTYTSPAGMDSEIPNAINTAGDIVAYGSGAEVQGGLLIHGGQTYLLTSLVASTDPAAGLSEFINGIPTGINDSGVIVIQSGIFGDLGAGIVLTPTCVADFNGDTAVNVNDIFAFLRAWFAHQTSADVNADSAVNVNDIFAFLRAWFAKC